MGSGAGSYESDTESWQCPGPRCDMARFPISTTGCPGPVQSPGTVIDLLTSGSAGALVQTLRIQSHLSNEVVHPGYRRAGDSCQVVPKLRELLCRHGLSAAARANRLVSLAARPLLEIVANPS